MQVSRRRAAEIIAGGVMSAAMRSSPGLAKPSPVSNRRQAVQDYIRKLPTWDQFSTSVSEGTTPSGAPAQASLENGQSCTRTEYTLSKNSDRLVIFDPDREILWPGALVQGKGYAEGLGSLRELPIKKRAPLVLGLSNLADKNSVTVKQPTATAVNSAIADLIKRVVQQKTDFGSRVSFASTTSYSAEQAMLDVGISAKYAGASLSATHRSETNLQKSSATTYFIQNMFTVFVETALTPADIFSNDLTIDDLNEQAVLGRLSPANIPVILSSISYGRILYVTTTAQASADEVRTAVAASFSAGGGGAAANLSQSQKNILANSQISITALGGSSSGVIDLIKSGKTADYFNAPATEQSVQPISFSFRNLSDLSLAAIRDTTKYTITECSAVVASKDIIARTDAIALERAEMFRNVLGAVSNSSDPGRRSQLMGFASRSMDVIVKQIQSIKTATIPASDKQWVKGVWMLRFLGDIESDITKASREIPANSSDPGTQSVWRTSLQWSQSIKAITTGVQASI